MLYIHRSERADALVDGLGELLREPLTDVMQAEIVAVPSRGVERWLAQRVSRRLGTSAGGTDGVCANVVFPFPGTLIGDALSSASGIDPATDPWRPERAVWPLLEVVDAHLEEPWLAALAGHLRNAGPDGALRRFATVRHIADLYDRYGVHRPEMLRSWAAGGAEAMTPEERWQADLWRRLREQIGIPSPAERLTDARRALREDAALADLPQRFSLFGMTRLPASYLDVLVALAHRRDVHLFLLHPSPVLWERLADHRPPRGLRRADDPSTKMTTNPLLGSWGRDAREMQLVLAAAGDEVIDDYRPAAEGTTTLLRRIQKDIRDDWLPPGSTHHPQEDARPILHSDDRSIQVHACHGRARQVEVLRDAVLHLLEDDPDLEPRDILVMCPDIETYAPFIVATFGVAEPVDGEESVPTLPDLSVRLADRSLRQTNPTLSVIARLLELVTERVTAPQVLDLAGRDPVRCRFGLDDDDLARLGEWVVASGVRWGFDAERRTPYKLGSLEANTWRTGLDRALLGVTMAEERQRLVGGVLPLDDVDSGDIELVGRFAELVDRLDQAVTALGEPKTVDAWADSIAQAADSLTSTSESDAWQREELQRLLDDLIGEATTDDTVTGVVLEPSDVVSLLSDRLKGRPTRANFRTGHLTVCTLVPMRSVPHRVVCLLGLDDGAFPRVSERDGDDLTLADPHVGDRDPRSEDRQLLLDALLAATDTLLITYTGRDERTNVERPPAVPVGELLDVVERTVRTGDGSPVRGHIVVQHPLQPFDARNYTVGELVPGRPWGFDPVNLEGAKASVSPRQPPGPYLPGPLPDIDTAVVEMDDLDRFLRHPVRAFLRQRLGIRLGLDVADVDDALPVELDALERWALGDRLLTARMAGAPLEACVAAERTRGVVPPGALAERIFDRVVPEVQAVVAAAQNDVEPVSMDVNITLDDGTRIVGTVPQVRGDVIHAVSFSRLGPHQRLQAWLRLLALSVGHPDRSFTAMTVGRLRNDGPPRTDVSLAHIDVLGADAAVRQQTATRYLGELVDLYRRGMREPVPIYCKTTAAWAKGSVTGRVGLATKQWTSEWNSPKEDADPEHKEVLGGVVPFERLLEELSRPDESGEGWDTGEETRFGRYALRLWSGLLSYEKVTDQ
ncbi:MAG: exodeoxyribonuclease V subunit gamma [Acidimicrobiales bacterium]